MKPLVAVAAFVFVALVSAADLSGSWTFQGEVANNAVDFTCAMKQEGEKLSCPATLAGSEVLITGTVKEKAVSLTFDIQYGGNIYNNVYNGTIQDDGSIKGSIEVAGQVGAFTATRK